MKMANQFLAGSALCLLMAVPSSAGVGGVGAARVPADSFPAPIILAQAEEPGAEQPTGAEECPPGTVPAPEGEEGCVAAEEEAPPEEAPPEEAPPEEAPPVEEAPVEESSEPEAEMPAEPGVEPEAAPAETETEAPAEDPPAAEQQTEPDAPAEAAPAETAEQPAEEPAAEECPAGTEPATEGGCVVIDQDVPVDGAPAEEEAAEPVMEPAAEPEAAPADEAPAEPEAETSTEEAPAAEPETPAEAAPAEEAEQPAEAPAADECPAGTVRAEDGGECVAIDQEAPAEETPAAPAGEAPAPEEAAEEEALPEDAAPVLDSQKEETADEEAAPTAEGEEQPAQAQEPAEGEEPAQEAQQPDAEEAVEPAQQEEAAMPQSDEEAQQQFRVEPQQLEQQIEAIVEEEGERIELGQTPEDMRVRRAQLFETRDDVRVVEQYNDNRIIVEINNEIYVESPDYDRLVRRDDLVYYEELPDGRVREVIERSDGTRIITVRNRYGDVLRRVRVMPDGQRYVLFYVPEDRFDDVYYFEDPALDLPPLRLTIPVSEYILEAERVEDPDRYYEFLHQPPVEPVRRLYSMEEVTHSARVRDMVRRIDLDTIEFEFGSARIEEREIADLEAVADAILRLLEENPAETFLIEGHTDAVGSREANLALSDRRAEAVAMALTNVFGVPPENLVTQGYGERYLKIETQRPERENRRVAIRRITPLVSPVASAR